MMVVPCTLPAYTRIAGEPGGKPEDSMVRPSKLQPLGAPGSFFSSGIELSEQFCQRTAVCVKSEVRSSEEAWQPCRYTR